MIEGPWDDPFKKAMTMTIDGLARPVSAPRATLGDRLRGTALELRGKTIAITGASGSLGQALVMALHGEGAQVIALTTGSGSGGGMGPIALEQTGIEVQSWKIGEEGALAELLGRVDILVINHGINRYGARSMGAIEDCYQVNTISALRLVDLFLQGCVDSTDPSAKEVWVNTSEAESNPAFSPLYELSKRALGDLITLRRLDAPCVIRKLVLGPFKSNLNPIGILSAPYVARQIVFWAKRDARNIIVTINPLTFVTFPLKEWSQSLYFRLFTKQE
jgi:monoglucosyldiacylglycerol epimerase